VAVPVQLGDLLKGNYAKTPLPDPVIVTVDFSLLQEKNVMQQILESPLVKPHITHLLNEEDAISAHFVERNLMYDNGRGPTDVAWQLRNNVYTQVEFNRSFSSQGTLLRLVYPANDPHNHTTPAATFEESTVTSTTPLILLDVDGVINTVEDNPLWTDNKTVHVRSGCRQFKITYSQSVVKRINSWSDKAEIQWLTTWKAGARYRIAPAIGLKGFKVCKSGKTGLADFLPEGYLSRPIIWIDDELKLDYKKDVEKMQQKVKAFLPLTPSWGLGPKDLDEVDNFITSVGSSVEEGRPR
jgi:hypothetical protein